MNLTISLIAVIISLIALSVSLVHNRRSVLPLLATINHQDSSSEFLGWMLCNQGLGPAIVTSINVEFEGKSIEGFHTSEIAAYLKRSSMEGKMQVFYLVGDTVIPKDGSLKLISLNKPYSDDIIPGFQDFLTKLRLTVEYRSIYSEKQTLDIYSKVYAATHRLPPPEHRYASGKGIFATAWRKLIGNP